MKKSYPALVATVVALLVTGCACTGQSSKQMASNFINRDNVTTTVHGTFPAKNPQTVAVYTQDKKPLSAYRVIGTATVSKENLLGMKREDADLHEKMKQLAASIGGDGLINVNNSDKQVEAKIIQYQRILI